MTATRTPVDPAAGARARILVSLANLQNARLLGDVLAPRYEIVHDIERGQIDLCIVDGVILSRLWEELAALRAHEEPVLLPVLLATDRRDVGLLTRDLWRVVDDVIVRPIEKAELRARLETLLRARRLSLELRRMSSLYEHERRIAMRLQEAALPSSFPDIPGVRFDAYYRPGSDEALVGGDWYDVVRLSDGRVVFSVGDVSGAGLDAAVTMSGMRHAFRGLAQVYADPGLMLRAADSALATEESGRHVTAFVAVFDPVTRFLTYASAGHPPAFLRAPDGSLVELRTEALPLGLGDRSARPARSTKIEAGAALVVYTDGLVEAERDVVAGLERLRRALADPTIVSAENAALAIEESVLDRAPHDDVAILVMRAGSTERDDSRVRRWHFASAEGGAARTTRHAVVATLRDHGLDDAAAFAAELVYGELIANVVRHAPGNVEVVLDLSAPAPVLHVLDEGPGFRVTPWLPHDPMSERGRGLFIVDELTEVFQVARRTAGGSHASAVLRPST